MRWVAALILVGLIIGGGAYLLSGYESELSRVLWIRAPSSRGISRRKEVTRCVKYSRERWLGIFT